MEDNKNDKWYVLYGDSHVKTNSFAHAHALLEKIMSVEGNKSVKILPKEEYLKLPNKKTKRGKKS
jgi:hypothetical protein